MYWIGQGFIRSNEYIRRTHECSSKRIKRNSSFNPQEIGRRGYRCGQKSRFEEKKSYFYFWKYPEFFEKVRNFSKISGIFRNYPEFFENIRNISKISGIFLKYPEFFEDLDKNSSIQLWVFLSVRIFNRWVVIRERYERCDIFARNRRYSPIGARNVSETFENASRGRSELVCRCWIIKYT